MKPQLRNSLRRPTHDSNSVDDTNFFLGGGEGGKNSFVEYSNAIRTKNERAGKAEKIL